ncbi:hypothetical protein ACIBIZ_17150 [Nonomuraea spiralis]|uniref:hypothetical protein n=1 Tax=Nonomuraea TaxID=83681 RepID=UPI000F79F418|nr:hypothetical protein [Nonomuraea sp. WAC 01424]RSN01011.1 hypothetical protein DMB42_39110 [Nonomuraea sp. WAC 01424]
MLAIGPAEALVLLMIWVVPAVVLFFLIYWAVRLAIRHERQRMPSLHERVTTEREAQRREWAEREARRNREAPDEL